MQICRLYIYIFLCIYNNAFEYSFLTTAEKLIQRQFGGQLSYAVGNARALELATAGSRNMLAAVAVEIRDFIYAEQKNCSFGGGCSNCNRWFHGDSSGASCSSLGLRVHHYQGFNDASRSQHHYVGSLDYGQYKSFDSYKGFRW